MLAPMRILFVGEIVGKAGRFTIRHLLSNLVAEKKVDFVIANANGATGGFGLGRNHAIVLHKKGIDVLTGGQCVYYKKDIVDFLPKAPWILRPANLPAGIPGRGWGVYHSPAGDLGIICMIGQAGYSRIHGNNPYTYLPDLVERIKERTNVVVLNFHAMTTAERRTMAFHSDGRVSMMIGTGTRCQTADAALFPGGTAIITDVGRTGSRDSVFGVESETELRILQTGIPERSKEGWGTLRLQGLIGDIGADGKAQSLELLDIPCEEEPV